MQIVMVFISLCILLTVLITVCCNYTCISLFSEQLFGGALSSSDDEVGPTINILDEDEDSRVSVDDSRFSESYLVNRHYLTVCM